MKLKEKVERDAVKQHFLRDVGDYCNFCGNKESFAITRDGRHICVDCSLEEDFCEMCGSIRAYEGQPLDEISHFRSECFDNIH